MAEIELIIPARDELGEGPLWNVLEQALYWLDIETRRYHRLDPRTGVHQVVEVGQKVGALAFRRQGGLVLAAEHGFAFYDPASGRLEHIGDPEAGKPQTMFNDGKVDRAGRFWAGTLGETYHNSLYRLDPGGAILRMETGVDISNGIGWSPDNRVMYFTNSTPAQIYAYDFDLASGSIANRRVFVDRSGQQGVPDGLTVDAEGYVWSAVWDGWCVERYAPDGRLAQTLRLPVQFPTSVAFGGSDLDELYITSAAMEIPPEKRADFPQAGGLFRVKGLAKGIPEPFFEG